LSAERRGHKKQVEEHEEQCGSGWGRRRGKGDDVKVDCGDSIMSSRRPKAITAPPARQNP